MEIKITRVHTAILFAILFLGIGWMAPAAYTSYAPQDQFITVHEYSAENAQVGDSQHLVCFDRTVHRAKSGTIFTELYLVDGSDKRVEIESHTMERYFQDGRTTVETRMSLPENLEPGTYRYILVIEMDLTRGRVQREFEFTSEPFEIENSSQSDVGSNFSCTRPKDLSSVRL